MSKITFNCETCGKEDYSYNPLFAKFCDECEGQQCKFPNSCTCNDCKGVKIHNKIVHLKLLQTDLHDRLLKNGFELDEITEWSSMVHLSGYLPSYNFKLLEGMDLDITYLRLDPLDDKLYFQLAIDKKK